jgi:hypothetical protein
MKPGENPISGAIYYPLERDYVEGGCSLARMNGYYNDLRYADLGSEMSPAITQYDVQRWSGVFNLLSRMPMAQDTYGSGTYGTRSGIGSIK